MNAVAAIIGYAVMAALALCAVTLAWWKLLRWAWRVAMDSRDFYKIAVAYGNAHRKGKKLVGSPE